MRWRRPAVSGCTATSWPACETRTFPPATTTCTLSPNRRQCRRLLALEPCQRHFAGGAMHPLVGDLAHPPVEVTLQRRPADEVMAGNGVALDIADAAFVPGLRRGRLVWGFSCQAIFPPLSVGAVAARRLDRLKLLEVEFGDGLPLVWQR